MIFIFLLISLFLPAQASVFDWHIWQGDSSLQKADYKNAKQKYLEVQSKDPHNPRVNYNLGIALYRENDYKQALFNFAQSAKDAQSKSLKEKAFYNLGNSYFKLEDYQSAISAYENALKIIPDDEDAKYNLELAKKKLQEKPEDKKEDQKQDNKNDSNQDQKQDPGKNSQDQKNNPQKSKNNEQQSSSQKQNSSGSGQGSQENPGLSPEETERLLMQIREGTPPALYREGEKENQSPEKFKPW